MQICNRLLLLSPHGAEPVDIGPEALIEDLVESNPLVTPAWRIRHRDVWLPLPEHPDRPWLDVLLARAVAALRAANPDLAEFLCRRILEHARPGDLHAAVQSSQFLLAHLDTIYGQWPSAAERLKTVTGGSPRFQACVQNNLAYVQCRLGQPLQACQLWLAVGLSYPQLATIWLSLRNVAEVMLDEGEERHSQLPSWEELKTQATQALSKLSWAVVDGWLRDDAPFPAYESLSVFLPGRYFPPLSSGLPPDDAGESAGRQLLADATSALAAQRPELAQTLAARAASESPKVAVAAQETASQAARQSAEGERLAEAGRFQRLVDRLDRELAHLTIDDLGAPQGTLHLIEALFGAAAAAECRARYQRRVVALSKDAAEKTVQAEQAHWLSLVQSGGKTPD